MPVMFSVTKSGSKQETLEVDDKSDSEMARPDRQHQEHQTRHMPGFLWKEPFQVIFFSQASPTHVLSDLFQLNRLCKGPGV